ncbi:MAG TPA: TetR/AcrR family transcriptional regulator [Thioalkalivibrio sp.]|nr:TetR/AcrR family transcriptional regulator [Thioalkalivibrio sp.]
MTGKGSRTRERILEAAHDLVMRQGYAATSIDQILEAAGITKGAFFYHFKSKASLAQALVERYAAFEEGMMRDILARAEKLSADPLQQVLIVVGLMEELFEGLEGPHPGCLFASYCYQNELLDEDVKQVCTTGMLEWRRVLVSRLEAAAERYPPRLAPDYRSLADMLTVVLEGAFVVARTLGDSRVIVEQLRHYRSYLELLFAR